MALVHGAQEPLGVRDGLILYLDAANARSYPRTGLNWFDRSGNGRNGTLKNGPTYSSSNFGSLSFDGTDDYVYVSTTFPTVNNFTVNFWIKSNTTDNHRGIFCIKNSGEPGDYRDGNFAIHTISGGYFGMESTELYSGNTSKNNTVIYQNISYCSVVCDQTNLQVRYYLNGNLDGTQVIATPSALSGHNALFLGCRQYSTTGENNYQNPINANVYSYQYYNRALSATEIAQNYNALKSRYI